MTSALICLLLLAGEPEAAPRPHPFLLVVPADVERARTAVRAGGPLSDLARKLAADAERERIEDLPPLERDWWDRDREKPWSETYPQTFHHTWMVPSRWAGLARRCAWASAIEPESPLAEKGRRILLGLSSYSFEFEHYDVGMNYTVWGIQALESYDILYDSFSEEERARLDAFFGRFEAAVRKSDAYWVEHEPGGALNNHYAWHKLGMAAIGLFYERPELVEEAMRGPKGVETLLRHGLVDDGLWVEGSIPYQLAATAPLVLLAEMLQNARSSFRIWGREVGDGRTLEGAYDALIGLLLPDRTLPPVGDAYALRPHVARYHEWEILGRRFRRPHYVWLIRDLDDRPVEALLRGLPELGDASPPPLTSRLWLEHGYAALRSVEGTDSWSGRGWTLFATWGANPVHAHADRLSIQLFADGHLWLPDCEARTAAEHAFSSRVQGELNRETLCHNALLVDRSSQHAPNRRLELLEYQALPLAKRLTVGDLEGRLYPGVRQLRTSIVREAFVLDLLEVESDRERRLEWLVHVDGTPEAEEGGSLDRGSPADVPATAPWRYLREPRKRRISARYGETFVRGGGRLRLDLFLAGCEGAPVEILTAGFPRDDGPSPETIPMRAAGLTGKAARFLAVYRSGETCDLPLEARVAPGRLGALEVTVTIDGRAFRHRMPALANAR